MNYYGCDNLIGGKTHYGSVAGILSLCSSGPRLPGDPGHAQTFNFPVSYAVVEDVTIKDLIDLYPGNLDKIIKVAKQLESKGVRFIATSCGLFAPFQNEIAKHLSVPFLSSALQIVAPLRGLLSPVKKIAVITGMEDYPEFTRIVLEGGSNIDPEKFRQDVTNTALSLRDKDESIGMVVLECPNIITFRNEIQRILNVPVYDIVSMVNFFAAGYQLNTFSTNYI